jgi:hypothetical protein
MFRLIKKKEDDRGVSTSGHTVLDLGLSTPPRREGRPPARSTPGGSAEGGGSSLGDILAKVLESRDQDEYRDRHLQRLAFFNRQLAHLTCFLQMTPNVPMAPGARRTLESVLSAITELTGFLAAECAVSQSPPSLSQANASLDEAGLGELVVDEALSDPEALKTIELDLDGMRDEVLTIQGELAEDRAWLKLLRSGEEATSEALRARLTETYTRASELLRECQDVLSRVPLHDDRLVDDLAAAEAGPDDEVEPFALDLDGPVPPLSAPSPTTRPPAPPTRDGEGFSVGNLEPKVPAPRPAPASSPPSALPAVPMPLPALPPLADVLGFSFGDVEPKAPPARPVPPAPAVAPPPTPTGPSPRVEVAPEAKAASDPEEELRSLQKFFNDNSPAGSLTEACDAEFRSRVGNVLRLSSLASSLSESALDLRMRQLKSTLGLRKKLSNRMTLPELLGFFR